MATRYKAQVSVMEKPWGEAFTYEIKYEIETKKPAIFAIVMLKHQWCFTTS